MQSSSTGGDQELDSRGEPMSSLFNPTRFKLYSFNNNNSLSFDDHTHNQQVPSYNFDPTTSSQSSPGNFIINNATTNNNSSNDLDIGWPNKFGSIRPTIISSHVANTAPYGFNLNNFNYTTTTASVAATATPNEASLHQQPPPPLSAENSPRALDHQGGGGGSRNPKKRSRASRKAPTTVLTTDTNNFRQMVQEFTGIPAPPFSASGTFPSPTRFDLFGGLGIQLPRLGCASVGLDMSNPPYLLRPCPQKAIPQQVIPTATLTPVQSFCLGASAPSTLPSGAMVEASTRSISSTINHFPKTTIAATSGSFEVQPHNLMSTKSCLQTILQQDSNRSDVKSNNAAETLIMREYGLSHATTTTTMITSTTPAMSLGARKWSALNQTSCNGIDTSTGNHGGS